MDLITFQLIHFGSLCNMSIRNALRMCSSDMNYFDGGIFKHDVFQKIFYCLSGTIISGKGITRYKDAKQHMPDQEKTYFEVCKHVYAQTSLLNNRD